MKIIEKFKRLIFQFPLNFQKKISRFNYIINIKQISLYIS